MIEVRYRVLDARIGASIALPSYATPGSAAMDLRAAPEQTLTLELVENPDILRELAALQPRPFLAGFAAETDNLEAHARAKLAAKGVDLIAANEVGAGVGIETVDNALSVFWAGGVRTLPRADKRVLARQLVALIAERRAQAAQ